MGKWEQFFKMDVRHVWHICRYVYPRMIIYPFGLLYLFLIVPCEIEAYYFNVLLPLWASYSNFSPDVLLTYSDYPILSHDDARIVAYILISFLIIIFWVATLGFPKLRESWQSHPNGRLMSCLEQVGAMKVLIQAFLAWLTALFNAKPKATKPVCFTEPPVLFIRLSEFLIVRRIGSVTAG